jgi:hypothetical protein
MHLNILKQGKHIAELLLAFSARHLYDLSKRSIRLKQFLAQSQLAHITTRMRMLVDGALGPPGKKNIAKGLATTRRSSTTDWMQRLQLKLVTEAPPLLLLLAAHGFLLLPISGRAVPSCCTIKKGTAAL